MPFFRSRLASSGGGEGGEDHWEDNYISISDSNNIFSDYPALMSVTVQTFNLNQYSYDINSLKEVRVGKRVTNFYDVFSGYRSMSMFNGKVNLYGAESLVYARGIVNNCYLFNSTVIFPDHTNAVIPLYYGGPEYNYGSGVSNYISFYGIFNQCTAYNRDTAIRLHETSVPDDRVVRLDIGYMFNRCTSFNSKVTLDFDRYYKNNENIQCSSVIYNCMYMFSNCFYFNQPMIFPKGVNYGYYLFNGCYDFNQPVVFDCGLSQDITMVLTNCLYDATNMKSDIILTNVNDDSLLVLSNFVQVTDNTNSINIYSNNTDIISSTVNLCVGGGTMSWTSVTNGVYNELYNIYVLNNVSDGLNAFNSYYYDFYGVSPVFN